MGEFTDRVEEVWVTGKTSGTLEYRESIPLSDLREVVTHTLTPQGANGPNSVVTQYILLTAERKLYEGLRGAFETGDGSGRDGALLGRLLPLETFGPEVLDISRNNLRRRWATTSDWLDDVIAYAMRPGRADPHAKDAVARAASLLGQPLGQVIDRVAAGEVEAERDPTRFALAEMLRTVWPDHPAVRRAQATHDEYAMRWWVPVYEMVLSHYGLRLLDGLRIDQFAWPLLALVDHESRTHRTHGNAAHAIEVLIAGATADCITGDRLTPEEVANRMPAPSSEDGGRSPAQSG